MAVFKCKMCSGELEITEGITVVECEYCGTKQTVPTAKDENLHPLFNRANTLRIKGEFDKAEKIYEKIIGADETQAEAYWGLILCKYGIEYVEDPATFKRVPTCHRASFDSIVADDDYKTALKYADGVQRGVYESEAVEIDRIQKEILALSQKEEPYDVFICYKETDETGRRTQDSVIANDIYHQLTQEGFKVFYAAITLEDKLGSAYEPCIFAALNSAKVMLAIGTKPEYFNAVWVKNEWSRYLKLIKTDRSRILIPCYRDMDAYELPEEFSHLQAQDMSKIGFINDVVRGIKKVIVKDEKVTVKTETVVTETAGGNVASLLKRAFMFLEDGDFARADEYCEKVLDIEPECSEAYLGKLMGELKITKQEDLKNCKKSFENNNNYIKAFRFADDKLAETLKSYLSYIKYERPEIERKDLIYNKAVELIQSENESDINQAKEMFDSIKDWRDSAEWIARSEDLKKVVIYNKALKLIHSGNESNINQAKEMFDSIKDWRDSAEWITRSEDFKKDVIYNKALKLIQSGDIRYIKIAKERFDSINGWRDSAEWISRSEDLKKDVIYSKAMSLINSNDLYVVKNAQTLLKQISGYKDVDKQIIIAEKNAKKIIYKDAMDCVKKDTIQSLSKAISLLSSIEDWTDSKEKIVEFKKRIKELEIKEEKRIEEENRLAEEKRIAAQNAAYRQQDLCQRCGGTFKGLFTKKCSNCGKLKDY